MSYSFPILNHCSMFNTNCSYLTCIQVSQKTGKVVQYSHLIENFLQFSVSHTVKGFQVVNEAETDVFLELLCFLHDTMNVGNLISSPSASLKPSLYICKFSVHVLLNPSLKNFEHNLASL